MGKVYGFAPTVPFFSASAIGVTVGEAAPTSSNTEEPTLAVAATSFATQTFPDGSMVMPVGDERPA